MIDAITNIHVIIANKVIIIILPICLAFLIRAK